VAATDARTQKKERENEKLWKSRRRRRKRRNTVGGEIGEEDRNTV
jgi:hypothetical protein